MTTPLIYFANNNFNELTINNTNLVERKLLGADNKVLLFDRFQVFFP